MGEQTRLPFEIFSAKNLFASEVALKLREHSLNQIAARARITTDELDRRTAVAPPWRLTQVLKFLVNSVIRRNEEDLAERYQGSSWCDSSEYDLNCDVATGQRTRR
jgi:hypothetical protein